MQKTILSILCLLVLLSACGGETPTTPPAGSGTPEDTRFRELSRIVQPDPLAGPVAVSTPVTNVQGGTVTVTTRYRIAPGFDELLCMAPGSDTLWPGALLYGASIPGGEYLPVLAPRTPVTFSISLGNIQGGISRTVAAPSLSTIRQAVTDLLAQNITGSTPARTAFSISDVYNEDQLQIALGGNYGNGVISVRSQFDFHNSSIRSRVLVKFVQVYYTIDIDLPDSPSALFADAAAAGTVLPRCAGISPLYVSSVSYGRLALFSFESTSSNEELKAALAAAFSGLTAKGELSLTVRQQEVLRTSTIKATIIGGNGGMAVHAVNGLEGLKAFVLTGGNCDRDNPGAPLAYRFRYLSDNASCRIVFASEYETVETIPVTHAVRVYEMSLTCVKESDAGDCEELYGSVTVGCRTGSGTVTWLQGYQDGAVAPPRIWDIPASGAWELREGQTRAIPGSRDFHIPAGSLADATLVITGHVKEEDTWGNDDLGTRTLEIPVADLTEGPHTLGMFTCGWTRVQIAFRARPLP